MLLDSILGAMSAVGVTGVTAGEGSEERIGSLSGLSKETSSVASRHKLNKLIKEITAYSSSRNMKKHTYKQVSKESWFLSYHYKRLYATNYLVVYENFKIIRNYVDFVKNCIKSA